MAAYPALELLLKGYFTQDLYEEYGEPWAAVDDFVAKERIARQVPDEIRGLLSAAPDEDTLRRVIVNELDSSYLPEADGWTLSEWLSELKRRVEQGTSRD